MGRKLASVRKDGARADWRSHWPATPVCSRTIATSTKYLHDQTVHLANLGYGPTEIAERIHVPEALSRNWSNHGYYYGGLKLGSRGVYHGVWASMTAIPPIWPLPPADLARRYVDATGGGDAILAKAQTACDAGDYRWVAELLRQLILVPYLPSSWHKSRRRHNGWAGSQF